MIAIFPGTALGNQQRFAIRLCEPTPHYLDNEITVLVTATGTAACPAQSSQPEWYSAPRRWDEQRDNVLNAAGVDIPHDSHDHPMLLGLPAKVSLALNVAGASYGDIDAVGGCLRAPLPTSITAWYLRSLTKLTPLKTRLLFSSRFGEH